MITKKIKHKDSTGVVHEYDIGADAKNISEDTTHRFVSDDEKKSWNGKMDPSGNASDSTVAFQQAASRANILTGEKMTGLFGKIAKWFSDLKNHSFADLIQNASTADTTRAVSAAVAKNLQDQITAQNTNMIYRPFVLSKWCNGGEQINLLVDVSKAEKRRLPIFIGGNIGGGSFLQMGLLDNLTASSTEIKFTAILISDSGLMRAYANLNNGSANMYRIMIQSASGMGQHIFVMIPAANVRLENTW